MKMRIWVTAAIVTPMWLTTAVKAEYPAPELPDGMRLNLTPLTYRVQHLLETKQCQGCDLSGANMTNANLTNADLRDANLRDAVLVGANLTNANLQGVNLTCANLTNAKLTNVNLGKANLIGTTGLERTGATISVEFRPPGRSAELRPPDIRSVEFREPDVRLYPIGAPVTQGPPRVTRGNLPRVTRGNLYDNGKESVIALMPDYKYESALTVAEYPTFLVYVPNIPQTASRTAKFVLEDEKGNEVYRTTLTLPSQGSIVSIRLPATRNLAPLEIGKKYFWYFQFQSEDSLLGNHVGGFVERVKLCPTLVREIEKAAPNERSAIYATAGIWYEALTTLAELRRANPNDVTLTQQWEELLKSVGLEHIAKKTLLESLPQSNESRVQPLGTEQKPNPPAARARSAEVKPSGGYAPPDVRPPSPPPPTSGSGETR